MFTFTVRCGLIKFAKIDDVSHTSGAKEISFYTLMNFISNCLMVYLKALTMVDIQLSDAEKTFIIHGVQVNTEQNMLSYVFATFKPSVIGPDDVSELLDLFSETPWRHIRSCWIATRYSRWKQTDYFHSCELGNVEKRTVIARFFGYLPRYFIIWKENLYLWHCQLYFHRNIGGILLKCII